MRCFRCGGTNLPLAALSANQAKGYPLIDIVLRECAACGLPQNHYRRDPKANKEPMDPFEVAEHAPVIQANGLIVPAKKVWVKPTAELMADRARQRREARIEVRQQARGTVSVP